MFYGSRVYQQLCRQIAQAQANREGGCFAETLMEIRSKATAVLAAPISDQEKIAVWSGLMSIVNTVPLHQTPEALETTYQAIDNLFSF